MKNLLVNVALLTVMSTTVAVANNNSFIRVDSEQDFRLAIDAANHDSRINKIIFKKNAFIELHAPIVYEGTQALTIFGNNSVVDGSHAGSFELGDDLIAVTKDATLIFNTSSNVTINKLSVENSATRGIVVNLPADSYGKDIEITLNKVTIIGSALYGLHIDDNADDFDDGSIGSDIGIELKISQSSFTHNGTGAIDFDGIRVDERGPGDIHAIIMNTHIDTNGGDGIELDEAGPGDVFATMMHVTLNGNGYYNELDLDDGFDIDEADAGDLDVNLFNVEVNDNQDEGLDFDESGEGGVHAVLRKINATGNFDEAIKIDEEDAGDIVARMAKVNANNNGDDGIQLTELGAGKIKSRLRQVNASHNAKYGIKMEQWVIEDEEKAVEKAGRLVVKKLSLEANGNGDEIKTNNVTIIEK